MSLFICGCSEGFVWLPRPSSCPPPFHDHSLRRALIFDNKPRSNLSFVRRRADHRMCAVGDLNADSGSAGSKEGKYKTLGERRFIQSAGMVFSRERLFPLCCWVGVPHVCASVCRSVSHSFTQQESNHRAVLMNFDFTTEAQLL